MKNLCLYACLILLLNLKSFAQGSDVIFLLDNSGSITDKEYSSMKSNVQGIIAGILECDPNNRVTVVQYGGALTNPISIQIWIESDFTNDYTIASSFLRRTSPAGVLGIGDFTHETLESIARALDGIILAPTHPNRARSPQKTLSHSPSKSLVVFLFTDADRHGVDTSLVNYFSFGYGTDEAFLNYTDFKNDRSASFLVQLIQNASTKPTAAAIASGSAGPYMGTVESYPSDPDGPGSGGRYLFDVAAQVSDMVESVCKMNCNRKLTLFSSIHDVGTGITDHREAGVIIAQNTLNNGGIGNYKGGQMIHLKSGFHAKSGSDVRAYINNCNGIILRAPEQMTFDSSNEDNFNSFTLFPNPTIESSTLQLSDGMIQSVTITSMDGLTMLKQEVNKKSIDLFVSTYKPGIYMITIQTQDGRTITEKLIKN